MGSGANLAVLHRIFISIESMFRLDDTLSLTTEVLIRYLSETWERRMQRTVAVNDGKSTVIRQPSAEDSILG